MATSFIALDTGSTLNTATYTVSEDAVTKHIPRSVLAGSNGTEKGIDANALVVAISNGTTAISGTVTVTGATTVINTVTVTGSTAVVGVVTVTGSTAVIGTVTVTGSTAVVGTVTVTGSTAVVGSVAVTFTDQKVDLNKIAGASVAVSNDTADTALRVTIASDPTGKVTITGSTTVINTVTVTGSTAIVGTVTVTGSTAIVGSVTVTGSTAVVGTVTVTGSTAIVGSVAITRGLKTGAFSSCTTTTNCTNAITVAAAVSNATTYISAYLISALTAGQYWLENDLGTVLTPYHFLAANGGASFTCVDGLPLSAVITNTTIKIKGTVAGSTGCLVIGYTA